MAKEYRSQRVQLNTIDDLLRLLGSSGSTGGSGGGITQNQAHNNFNAGVDALIETIKSSVNPQDIINAATIKNNLSTVVDPSNIEGIVKLNQADQNVTNTTQDYINYRNVINNGYDLINKWDLPDYSEAAPGATEFEIEAQEAIMPGIFEKTGRTIEDDVLGESRDEEIISDLYTVKNIEEALSQIENFESYLHIDPLKQKKELPFVGQYFLKNKAGQTITGDVDVINRTLKLKDNLLTALSALENDKMITNNEVYYILTGQKDKLETERTKRIKASKDNLISYRRSSNAIRSYRKQLLNTIADKDLDTSEVPFMDVLAGSEIGIEDIWNNIAAADSLDQNNPLLAGKSDEDITASKMNQYSGMSFDQVMNHWDKELIKYKIYSEREGSMHKLWAGYKFEFEDPTLEEITRRQLQQYIKSGG